MRGYHDLGGLPAGPVDPTDHAKALWEKRVHAMLVLLADPARRVMTVDELRRGIESLGAAEYDRLSYYERWITSITNTLLQKGVFTTDELGRKLAEVERREAEAP
jgi:Nitrile hydratase beta subunit